MKKMLLIVVIVIIICCLIPQKLAYYDGGSYEYRAVLYRIIHYHRLPPSPELEYTTGKTISILGFTIYENINNLYSANDIIKYQNSYDLIKCGYLDFPENKTIIKNYNDLKSYLEIINEEKKYYLLNKYDESFFTNKHLAFIYFPLNSGSNTIEYIGSIEKNNEIIVNYKTVIPETGTTDMNGYLLLIKVNQNIDNIVLDK